MPAGEWTLGMRLRARRRAGFSIVELLIASALFLGLMTCVFWCLVYSNRYLRNSESKVEAQTQALSASTWVSRSLSEGNITAMAAATNVGVSFPSPRDPSSGDVAWGAGSGALVWRQLRFCYLETPQGVNTTANLVMKGFPLVMTGTTPTVQWSGFPPFPADGVVDLPASQPVASGVNRGTPITKVIARNVRQFDVILYPTNDPDPTKQNCANITIETFAPYYGVDYGVTVRTRVRMQN